MMSSDVVSDPVMLALDREHFASPHGYQPPADVVEARKALRDLAARVEAKDWRWSRDERRLAKRYQSALAKHEQELVQKWGTEELAAKLAADRAADMHA